MDHRKQLLCHLNIFNQLSTGGSTNISCNAPQWCIIITSRTIFVLSSLTVPDSIGRHTISTLTELTGYTLSS